MHYSLTSCQLYFLVPLSSFLAHLLAISHIWQSLPSGHCFVPLVNSPNIWLNLTCQSWNTSLSTHQSFDTSDHQAFRLQFAISCQTLSDHSPVWQSLHQAVWEFHHLLINAKYSFIWLTSKIIFLENIAYLLWQRVQSYNSGCSNKDDSTCVRVNADVMAACQILYSRNVTSVNQLEIPHPLSLTQSLPQSLLFWCSVSFI